jgi:hypothetical protein
MVLQIAMTAADFLPATLSLLTVKVLENVFDHALCATACVSIARPVYDAWCTTHTSSLEVLHDIETATGVPDLADATPLL